MSAQIRHNCCLRAAIGLADCSATAIPVAAVLSSQTSNSDSADILATDPAILEFDVNMNMEELEMVLYNFSPTMMISVIMQNDSNLELRCVFFQFSDRYEN